MSKSSETKQITPFPPRSFPPRHVCKTSLLPLLKKAKLALNEFRTALKKTPSPTRLLAHLVTLEAIDSLESQNFTLPFTKFITTPKKERSVAQVYDYMQALNKASHRPIVPFSKQQICRIHKTVKRSTAPKKDLGRYRNRQNWIGPSNCSIEDAYFYPPSAKDVHPMMEELFRYSHRVEKEPLIQLALLFAQLLIIHPFMDGNGRVARIWVPLFLYQKKELPIPFFFMSGYFNRYRLKYFQTLFKTTEEDNWKDWISFFLKGVAYQSKRYCKAVTEICALHDKLVDKVPELNQNGRTFLFQHPIFTVSSFKKTKNSMHILQDLKKHKLVTGGSRNRYRFTPLLELLEKVN